MLLSSNYINNGSQTYAKQVHVYNGTVYAEIIYQDEETDKDYVSGLWYLSASKTFGPFFNTSSVKEKDLIAAHKWADEQLELINKYGTKKQSKAQVLRDLK